MNVNICVLKTKEKRLQNNTTVIILWFVVVLSYGTCFICEFKVQLLKYMTTPFSKVLTFFYSAIFSCSKFMKKMLFAYNYFVHEKRQTFVVSHKFFPHETTSLKGTKHLPTLCVPATKK